MDIFRDSVDRNKYFVAKYFLESKTSLKDAAFNLAVGQSIGSPSCRSEWETPQMVEDHCCKIIGSASEMEKVKSGIVEIGFPEANINFEQDGISHLLVCVFGGQVDIDNIAKCHLLDISFTSEMEKCLLGPKIGLKQVKDYCNIPEYRPIQGSIIKPKCGLTPERHLDLVKCLVDNGSDFIKEDEILVDQDHCPMFRRVDMVMKYIRDSGRKVFYCVSIHSDYNNSSLNKIQDLYQNMGINGIHVNFHCGFGIYNSIRKTELPILLHYQKSGDRILHNKQHDFHIDESLILKLVAKSGAGSLHTGMIGGYLSEDEDEMIKKVNMLAELNSIASLSCGMQPGLVDYIKAKLGHGNWMANTGGALFSHPMGTSCGVKAMRQAIGGVDRGIEYAMAIEKWGYKV